MEKTLKVTKSSVLYRKIEGLDLSPRERNKALAALNSADKLANAIFWVYGKLGRIAGRLPPNATLKHQ